MPNGFVCPDHRAYPINEDGEAFWELIADMRSPDCELNSDCHECGEIVCCPDTPAIMILWQPPTEEDPAIILHPNCFTAFVTRLARAIRVEGNPQGEGN